MLSRCKAVNYGVLRVDLAVKITYNLSKYIRKYQITCKLQFSSHSAVLFTYVKYSPPRAHTPEGRLESSVVALIQMFMGCARMDMSMTATGCTLVSMIQALLHCVPAP